MIRWGQAELDCKGIAAQRQCTAYRLVILSLSASTRHLKNVLFRHLSTLIREI